MKYQLCKKIFSILFVLLLVSSAPVFAADALPCDLTDDAPQLYQIVCPVARVINVLIIVVGVVLVVMIVMGALKMSLALGDPKGFSGALTTWQFAAIGGFIVVGVFAILFIIFNLFGINLNPFEMTNFLANFILQFSESIGIH